MIIATNVNKSFGRLKALDNVSLTCNKGQSISLIGPNGSGKTTFIKCLLGMVVPDNGFITFNNKKREYQVSGTHVRFLHHLAYHFAFSVSSWSL